VHAEVLPAGELTCARRTAERAGCWLRCHATPDIRRQLLLLLMMMMMMMMMCLVLLCVIFPGWRHINTARRYHGV